MAFFKFSDDEMSARPYYVAANDEAGAKEAMQVLVGEKVALRMAISLVEELPDGVNPIIALAPRPSPTQ